MAGSGRSIRTAVLVAGLLIAALIVYKTILPLVFPALAQTEYDIPDKLNNKVIPVFNRQLSAYVERYTKGPVNCPGCIDSSYRQVERFYRSLARIESHTRYGLNSSQAHNGIELKLTYTDGRIADHVYTDNHWNGKRLLGAPLLVRVEMKGGQATAVYTNGVELKDSPGAMINDLDNLIEHAIHHDMSQNREKYFSPEKSEKDFKKEWDSL